MNHAPPADALPKVLATSVVRGAHQGESHGGVYLVDFTERQVRQVLDWNTTDIDWQGRGWDRGLRGIAFSNGEVYLAASDELFVFDRNFNRLYSRRCPTLRHCHEICRRGDRLYLTSTAYDSILAFDLRRRSFIRALHLAATDAGLAGRIFDPQGADGPTAKNLLHLNSVFADDSGTYVSGLRTGGLLKIGGGGEVERLADLPEGNHNARPFRGGVLFNDTPANRVRYLRADGSEMKFPVPQYDEGELTHLDLGDDQVARQGFGRGLCVISERLMAAGSSPSTITLWDLETGAELARVNFSRDIRNAIHGLEVWPF